MITRGRALTNLRKGVAEFCVLAELRHGPAYGLALAHQLETDGLVASPSTLYPMLSRLQTGGLVESEWVQADGARARKYFSLTDAGKDALDEFQGVWTSLRDAVDRTLKEES